MSLQIFPLLFFLFLELSFFRFRYQTVFFDYLLWFYVHFLQISLLDLHKVATFDFPSCFWLVPFMKVVKWSLRPCAVTGNSWQLFKLLAIFPASRFTFIYTLARHSPHHKNVLFLIPRHDRPIGRGGNRFVHSLFKTWWRKVTPREKKLNVRWKCEKEIVQNYSVTGNLEKMY